jgi:hypothetical protein
MMSREMSEALASHRERGDNLTGEILHRRGKKPNGCARNRSSRMIGVHEQSRLGATWFL